MAPTKLINLAREGFGLSLGFLLGVAVYVFVGMLFFVPGYFLFMGERKKGERANTINQGFGIFLMVLGVIITGGLGFGILLDSLSDMV